MTIVSMTNEFLMCICIFFNMSSFMLTPLMATIVVQLLSLAPDEMNKRRKEKLTAQLTTLEKDIALMEKPQVYVRTC